MTRKKKRNGREAVSSPSPLIAATERFRECRVVVGLSFNGEEATVGEVPTDLSGLAPYKKNRVAAIEVDSQAKHRWDNFYIITTPRGQKVVFHGRPAGYYAAGSSATVSRVLSRLKVQDVGMIAPHGTDPQGMALVQTLQEESPYVQHCLFRGSPDQESGGEKQLDLASPPFITPFTVSLIDKATRESTLFCSKSEYSVPKELLVYLQPIRPELLILTSIKPADWPLAQDLSKLARTRNRKVKIALVLSLEMIQMTVRDPALRREVLQFIRQYVDYVQMNEDEAAAWLDARQFHPSLIDPLAKELGARYTVVTLGKRGALGKERGAKLPDFVPATSVRLKGTSGAGDVFLAVLLYCLYLWPRRRKKPFRLALQAGCRAAAHKLAADLDPAKGPPTVEELVGWFQHEFK